jgi:hypothetical protein
LRLILHFGLHRAASSAIQRLLVENRRTLARQRVLTVTQRSTERDEHRVFKLIKGTRAGARGLDAAAADIERHLEGLARDYDTVVFSDENMPGLMPGRRLRAFAHRDELAHMVARLARSHDVCGLLVLRDHADYLESVHRFRAVRGEPRDFAGFVETVDLASLAYARLGEAMEASLGPGRLDVFSFESLGSGGGRAVIERLKALTGARLGTRELPVVNVSPEARFVALARTLHARGIVLPRREALTLAERLRALPAGEGEEEAAAAVRTAARRVFVPLTGDRRFRLARSLADRGVLLPGVSPSRAAALVAQAFAAAEESEEAAGNRAALKAALRRRFAADRAAVAARWLPEWGQAGEEGPREGAAALTYPGEDRK